MQIGPFTIDEANSDDEYLYVDVEGRGTVQIRITGGLYVAILPFTVGDIPIESMFVSDDKLFRYE